MSKGVAWLLLRTTFGDGDLRLEPLLTASSANSTRLQAPKQSCCVTSKTCELFGYVVPPGSCMPVWPRLSPSHITLALSHGRKFWENLRELVSFRC